MHDGSRQLGNVFLGVGERLQDILNDDRMFLPVHVGEQKPGSMVMFSKRYIQQIEEVRPETLARNEEVYELAEQGRVREEVARKVEEPPRMLDLELDD